MLRLSRPLLLVLCLGMVGCDHASKISAKRLLEGSRPFVVVSGWLDLRYVENTDMAFNALRFVPERARKVFLLSTNLLLLACLGAAVFSRRLSWTRRFSPLERAAAFVALAGACGNTFDRLARGHVVDFIHFHHWPVFNVADIYLGVAIGLVILSACQRPFGGPQDRPQKP